MAPRERQELGKTDWERRIALHLAKLRQAKFPTQADLAEALIQAGMPVTRQTVGNWETGLRRPNIGDLETIARVLGVSERELLPEPLAPAPDEIPKKQPAKRKKP
jgi:transcriptional regulator with XRE-family HTH domain